VSLIRQTLYKAPARWPTGRPSPALTHRSRWLLLLGFAVLTLPSVTAATPTDTNRSHVQRPSVTRKPATGNPTHTQKKTAQAKHVSSAKRSHDSGHGPIKNSKGVKVVHVRGRTPRATPDGEPRFAADEFSPRWGCAATSAVSDDVMTTIGINSDELRRVIVREAPEVLKTSAPCVPYALLVNPLNEPLALSIAVTEPNAMLTGIYTFAVDEQSDSYHFEFETAPIRSSPAKVTSFPLHDISLSDEVMPQNVPSDLDFEVAILSTTMADTASCTDGDNCRVRIVYTEPTATQTAELSSIELVDQRSWKTLDQALWLTRPGLPGGFFTPNGESFERQFWISPVRFTHVSRGVGASTVLLRIKSSRGKARRKVVSHTELRSENHIGVDFAAPRNTPVVSVADGRVIFSGPNGGYGNLIIIEHPGGYTTHYGHLNSFASNTWIGAEVRRGTEIGYVGSTGLSTGYHLHFEIRLNGAYLDPLDPSEPFALWMLRRTDYTPLVRQILTSSRALSALDLTTDSANTLSPRSP
jgi:Peptidase family M23